MKRRSSSSLPPWKRPAHIAWFILAIAGSCWITLHMPAESKHMKAKYSAVSARSENAARNMAAPGEQTRYQAYAGPISATDASENSQPAISSRQRPSDAGASAEGRPARKMRTQSDMEKILVKMQTFGRLFAIVGLAAFLGGLVEARRWNTLLDRLMGRLTRMARLPEVAGLAMSTALCSNAAANSILISSHAKGEIRTSALIAGGIANSYLAYISHAVRVMYPVIAAVGLPGALYFTVQFTGGFFVLVCVLLLNCWYVSGRGKDTSGGDLVRPPSDPLPWPQAISRSAVRSLSLLFRLVCMTVPLIVGIEWLLKNGSLDFWGDALPRPLAELFPAELLSVVAAQMGGLVQSSALAAHLRADGLINNTQILLAMLVGSAVGNPFRMLRRNLPSALGIFPTPIAFTIVLGMQLSRFLVTLFAITCAVAFITHTR